MVGSGVASTASSRAKSKDPNISGVTVWECMWLPLINAASSGTNSTGRGGLAMWTRAQVDPVNQQELRKQAWGPITATPKRTVAKCVWVETHSRLSKALAWSSYTYNKGDGKDISWQVEALVAECVAERTAARNCTDANHVEKCWCDEITRNCCTTLLTPYWLERG
jgi:hypothetical protein